MQREAAGFPPFALLARLRAEAKHVDTPMQFLRAAKALLLPYAATGSKDQATAGLALHGPLPAPMPRRAGMPPAQLLVSAANRRALHGPLDAAMPALYGLPAARKVRWSLDVDPVEIGGAHV